MDDGSQVTEFGKILIYLIISTLLVVFTILLAKFLSPKKPTKLKMSTYECGEEAQGSSWVQFNSRFYIIALIFLLFDVELVFIFPWATVFGQESLIAADIRWGWFTMIEMFLFVGILIIGLAYVWLKGDLDWVRPYSKLPIVHHAIPSSAYDRINSEHFQVKPFSPSQAGTAAIKTEKVSPAKPNFKPKFIKKSGESL